MSVLDKKFLGAPLASDQDRHFISMTARIPGKVARGTFTRADAPVYAAVRAGENVQAVNNALARVADKVPTSVGKFSGRLVASAISIPATPIVFGTTYLFEGVNKLGFGRGIAETNADRAHKFAVQREKERANSIFRRFRRG